MPSWIDFLSILAPNLAPKSTQNRSQNRCFCGCFFSSTFEPILDRFLIDLGPPGEWKMCKNNWFLWIKTRMRVFVLWSLLRSILDRFLITFGVVFGTILGSKLDPKSNSKFDRFLDWFFNDFGSFWESKLRPCWPHFWQKWSEAVGCAGFLSNLSISVRILVRLGSILERF